MVAVSVIIPTFGIPQYLKDAIDSVLQQSLANIELIIVDDNNPDRDARKKTETLIREYTDDRIRYIKHAHNMNGANARNTGLSEAHGKYIAFLDSDDVYMPNRLEKCLGIMETADKTVAGVYTGCEFRKKGKVYHVMKDVRPGNYLVETLACSFNFGTGSNIFVRKDIVNEINGFDGSFLRHQDYEFLVRIFEKYSLLSIPEVLVVKNNENLNLPNVEKMIDIKRQYLSKFKTIIDAMSEEERVFIFHSQYMQIAEAAQRIGKYKLAREFYGKANQEQSLSFRERIRRVVFFYTSLIFSHKK